MALHLCASAGQKNGIGALRKCKSDASDASDASYIQSQCVGGDDDDDDDDECVWGVCGGYSSCSKLWPYLEGGRAGKKMTSMQEVNRSRVISYGNFNILCSGGNCIIHSYHEEVVIQ